MLVLLFLFQWHKFLVATGGITGTGIVVDRNHNPHIFYYSRNLLVHAFWNGNAWQVENIDSAASYHNNGPAVAIDNQGRFHIAFFNKNERLSYGVYDQTWQIELVDTAYRTGDYCAIALDRNNRPHIAYHRKISLFRGYLRYAVKINNQWQIYEHSSESGGFHASLALDSLDYPHISDCTSWSGGDLRYIYYDGENWRYERPATGNVSGYNSLALDTFDRPQISFYWAGGGNYDLRFAEKNTGSWQIHIVDYGQQLFKRGWDNKIKIDNNNICHIIYHCHNECFIKYARGQEGNWLTEIIDTVGLYTASTAIALNNGEIFLSYYDENTSTLWCAATRDFTGMKETNQKKTFFKPDTFLKEEKGIQIYDLTGRRLNQDSFKLREKGIYFFKKGGRIYKVLII